MTFPWKNLVDLTHEIDGNTPAYPGDPEPVIESVKTVKSDGYAVSSIELNTHLGTHVDAPAHLLAGGRSITDYPLEALEGSALVMDAQGPVVTADAVKVFLADIKPRQLKWLLVRTGWSKNWEDGEEYFEGDYPVLEPQVAAVLKGKGIVGVGLDTPSPDGYEKSLDAHMALMRHGILILENLTNLERLPVGKDLWFSAWPLKTCCRDAAPVRAVARF